MELCEAVDRRTFMKLGTAAIASLAMPQWLFADAAREKTLRLYNIHTGESIRSTFWGEGGYVAEGLAEINRVLRDHRTGDIEPIDVGVLELLHDLQVKVGSEKAFNVISGYRSPRTNAMLNRTTSGVAKKSLHMQGMAIDVNLPGTQLAMLRKAALSQKAGGVGYYPTSNFVHLDVGRVRQWGHA